VFGRPLFHISGIPVTADPWAAIGFLVIYDLSGGGRRGLLAALILLIMTVIHEVGHAFTARHYGGHHLRIHLTFLGGWASYSDQFGLSRKQRNIISVMGPAVQLITAVGTLFALRMLWGGGDSPYGMSKLYYDLYGAVAWAGVLIAMLNLLPLIPLDGGNIVESWWSARRDNGRTEYLWFTLVAAVVVVVIGLGRTSYASSISSAGGTLLAGGYFDSFPVAIGKLILAGPIFGLTAWYIGILCGFNAFSRLRSEGSLIVSRGPTGDGFPKLLIPRTGRAPRPSRGAGDASRGRPSRSTTTEPGRAKKRGRNPKQPAPVVPIRPEARLDRADQADMDWLLDKINASGMASLTPDERRRLDEHSRRLRGQ